MKARIYATLVLSTLATTVAAQDLSEMMYDNMQFDTMLDQQMAYQQDILSYQMQDTTAQKQGLIRQYVQANGYGRLEAEYDQMCQQIIQYGYDCSLVSFDDYVWDRMLREEGVNTTAMYQNQTRMQQQNSAALQGSMAELSGAYDSYNQGYFENQAIIDQSMADSSQTFRGEWDYRSAYSDQTVTLPYAPSSGEVYTDGSNYYGDDGYNWYEYDNAELSGYGTMMEEVSR